MSAFGPSVPYRVDWIDVAKGFCIVLVVMMHSTLGVEAAVGGEGWMGALVAFAQPFRIPAFFLLAGLFLARRIDRPWAEFLDAKVVHFAYFYVLWVTIQFAFKAPGFAAEHGVAGVAQMYAMAFVQPFGTLWFIYLLPVFFVAARLVRPVYPWVVLMAAAVLEIAPIATGSVIVDEFCARFVWFYAGYALAPRIFAGVEDVVSRPTMALVAILVWAASNAAVVAAGLAGAPVVSLILGASGAAALIAVAALIAQSAVAVPFRICGANSIVIYLAFFLPMAVARTALVKLGIVSDVGMMSLIVTLTAVVAPLVLAGLTRGTRLDFLFLRPDWARLRPSARLVAAE